MKGKTYFNEIIKKEICLHQLFSKLHNYFFYKITTHCNSGVPRNFFRGGVQQIQLRTEDREDGDLGAVAL